MSVELSNPEQHDIAGWASRAGELDRECKRLRSLNAELANASDAFVKRHDEIAPALTDVFTFYAIHGMKWPDKQNWKAELDELRTAIAKAKP